MGPITSAVSPIAWLDRNKPGTPETRNAERINAPYRNGTAMLANDPNAKQVL